MQKVMYIQTDQELKACESGQPVRIAGENGVGVYAGIEVEQTCSCPGDYTFPFPVILYYDEKGGIVRKKIFSLNPPAAKKLSIKSMSTTITHSHPEYSPYAKLLGANFPSEEIETCYFCQWEIFPGREVLEEPANGLLFDRPECVDGYKRMFKMKNEVKVNRIVYLPGGEGS